MKEIKRIKADGTTSMVCSFVNDLSARENMKTFIILHHFHTGNVLDERLRSKADELIKEGKHHFMFEDGMDIYLIRKERA